jgi:hypothetical protein
MGTIIGHVDGFKADVLQGWIANLDDQSGLEQFIVRDEACRDLVLSTHTYREDVCMAHQISGLFGFALRRSWLDSRSKTVTILTRDGVPLPGGTDIPLPEAPLIAPSRRPVNIFLHLAKTAGTSVRHAVTQQLSEAEILLIYPGAPFSMEEHLIPTIPLYQRRRLRLVIGHCSFGVHERLGVPSRYSVFLREPAARLRSNFAHHGAAGTAFRVGRGTVGAVAAINDGLSEEFDNLMVRVIAGLARDAVPTGTVSSDDVDLALHNIREHFAFVGLHETMAESFAGLSAVLGVEAYDLPTDNVTPATWSGAEQQKATVRWDAVFERNRHDFALYKAVRETGLVGRL